MSSIFHGSSRYYAPIIFYFLLQIPQIYSNPEITVPLAGLKADLVVGVTDGRIEGQAIRTQVSFGFVLIIRFIIESNSLKKETCFSEINSGILKIQTIEVWIQYKFLVLIRFTPPQKIFFISFLDLHFHQAFPSILRIYLFIKNFPLG